MTLTSLPTERPLDAAALSEVLRVIQKENRNRDGTKKDSAELLREVRQNNPDLRFRLLRHVEPFDGSHQSAVLVTDRDGCVTTLSWSPPSTLPWPLRGARRVGESTLLMVDGEKLTVGDTIRHLDELWDRPDLLTELVDACIIRIALEEDPVELTDAQLQESADAFRRARGLLTPADTEAWLVSNHLSTTMFEEMVEAEANLAMLRRRIVGDRASEWLEANLHTLDRARIARVMFSDGADAAEFATRISDVRTHGSDDAIRYFAGELGLTVATGTGRAEFRDVVRDDPHERTNPVFAAKPGTVLPPRRSDDGWEIVQVLDVRAARKDASTTRHAEERIFDVWLADRRQAARVEWFWGEADKTDRVAR